MKPAIGSPSHKEVATADRGGDCLFQIALIGILVTQQESERTLQSGNIGFIRMELFLCQQKIHNVTKHCLKVKVICSPAGVMIDPHDFILCFLWHLQPGRIEQQIQELNLPFIRVLQKFCRNAKHMADHLLDVKIHHIFSVAEERNTHISIRHIFHHAREIAGHFISQIGIAVPVILLDGLLCFVTVRLPAFGFHENMFMGQCQITVQIGHTAHCRSQFFSNTKSGVSFERL